MIHIILVYLLFFGLWGTQSLACGISSVYISIYGMPGNSYQGIYLLQAMDKPTHWSNILLIDKFHSTHATIKPSPALIGLI